MSQRHARANSRNILQIYALGYLDLRAFVAVRRKIATPPSFRRHLLHRFSHFVSSAGVTVAQRPCSAVVRRDFPRRYMLLGRRRNSRLNGWNSCGGLARRLGVILTTRGVNSLATSVAIRSTASAAAAAAPAVFIHAETKYAIHLFLSPVVPGDLPFYVHRTASRILRSRWKTIKFSAVCMTFSPLITLAHIYKI